MRISFIGGGNMASALIGGLLAKSDAPRPTISVVEPLAAQRSSLAARFAVQCHEQPTSEALAADVVVLAVKPQQMREAASACAGHVAGALVISVAAGIRIADLQRWLKGHSRIVRAMPNTPALIGLGITGLCAAPGASESDRASAERILQAAGETVWVSDESLIDAVTAVSGSGPAYVFRFIEAIEQAGMALGLTAEQSRRLTLATFVGASRLAAQSDEPPSVLRERVTSKGGTTAAALAVMDAAQIGDIMQRALKAACDRGHEMGEEFGRQA